MTLEHRRASRSVQARCGLGWSLLAVGLPMPWLVKPPRSAVDHVPHRCGMAAAVLALRRGWRCTRRWPCHRRWCWGWHVAAVAQAAAGSMPLSAMRCCPSPTLQRWPSTVAVGHGAERMRPAVADALVGLVIAGIVSTGLALGQWQQLDMGLLAYPLPLGGRPVANIAQPNLLATLLAWSLAGSLVGRGNAARWRARGRDRGRICSSASQRPSRAPAGSKSACSRWLLE